MTAKREFYTTNEIAQILGLSPFTVRRYIQTRKLKAVKLEGSYRVRRSHLDDFIAEREIETEEELKALEDAEEEIQEPESPAIKQVENKKSARASVRSSKRSSEKTAAEKEIESKKSVRSSVRRPTKKKLPTRSSNRRKEEE